MGVQAVGCRAQLQRVCHRRLAAGRDQRRHLPTEAGLSGAARRRRPAGVDDGVDDTTAAATVGREWEEGGRGGLKG